MHFLKCMPETNLEMFYSAVLVWCPANNFQITDLVGTRITVIARSDEAISSPNSTTTRDCFASLAMTKPVSLAR